MSADDVAVEIIEEAEADLVALAGADPDTALEAVNEILKLRANPHLGRKMDRRPPQILEPCRKIYFGPLDELGRPTKRVIYVNEPEDGAPQVAVVLAVDERKNMLAHRKAATRQRRRGS